MQNSPSLDKLVSTFGDLYGGEPIVVRSPGRVNIIGEHTDYNEGFVLPAAIDKAAYVALGKREDEEVHLFASEFAESHTGRLSSLKPLPHHWANYILGVADQLQKRGHKIQGFNLVLEGDVPIGAGLSSSAAIECAVVFALDHLFGLGIPRLEMVRIAQISEQTFAGVMVGIMDQFTSMHGKRDHVIKLDCRSLEYEYVPLKLQGYKILLLNTNVKHTLSSSEYNTRRQQCEEGVAMVQKGEGGSFTSLRDVSMDLLKKHVKEQNPLIYQRCKYVVEENQRLLEGCEDLKKGDLAALGKKMFRTHDGLSKEYEVSCAELDFLVDFVRNQPAVLGARMMGGGFGGCTINLVKEASVEQLVREAEKAYKKEMNKELTPYLASIEGGTSIISWKH